MNFCDVDFNSKTSQYVNYKLPKKYERFQNEFCALKINNNIGDIGNIDNTILNGDVVILIRHPDHFLLKSGMLILAWTEDKQYHFTRYSETLESSHKIIAAAIEIQRSL